MKFPHHALTDVCEMILDDYDLNEEQVKALAANLSSECEGILSNRAEQAHENHRSPDDTAYRKSIIESGRGHLIGF